MLYKTCFKKIELYCQWSCDYKYVLDREGADYEMFEHPDYQEYHYFNDVKKYAYVFVYDTLLEDTVTFLSYVPLSSEYVSELMRVCQDLSYKIAFISFKGYPDSYRPDDYCLPIERLIGSYFSHDDVKYYVDQQGIGRDVVMGTCCCADDDYDYESKFMITQCYFNDEKYNKKYYYVLTVEKESSILFTKSEFWDMITE